MKPCAITGWSVSLLVHGVLAFLLISMLSADDPKKPEPQQIVLDLSVFEAPKPAPPKPEIKPEPKPTPAPPVKKAQAKKKAEPKKETMPKPKPKKKAEVKENKQLKKDLRKEQEKQKRLEQQKEQQRQQELAKQREAEQKRLEQQRLVEQRRREWQAKQAAKKRAATQQKAKAQAKPTAKQAAPISPPLITNPRYRSAPRPPKYPPQALRRKIEGTTIVRANVTANGQVKSAKVHRSSGNNLLDKAALKAVRGWQFVPASKNGKNIESVVQVPVSFKVR